MSGKGKSWPGGEGQKALHIIEKEYQSIGDHWKFTKKDFIECPFCTATVKICTHARHLKKMHCKEYPKVNQVRGCRACGADNVPVGLLKRHQNSSMENCQYIPIKFVSSDATFINSVKKTNSMNQMKKDISRTIGFQPEEIRFFLNNKKLVGNDLKALTLPLRKRDVIRVCKCDKNIKFTSVKKRKACEGLDRVTDPKVLKLIHDLSNEPISVDPTTSLSTEIDKEEQKAEMTPRELRMAALNYTDEQRAAAVKEVIEDHCSPDDLEKKYKICAWNIKDWVRIADHRLPESYGMETLKGSATEGQECVTLCSSEEEEAVMERMVTEWKVNETGTTEYKEDVEDVKDGEITGRNQRPNETFSRWDGSSLSSEPSVASTSRSFPGASLCLQAPAAASAEVKDQLSKPSLDVLGAWVLAPNSLYRAKCPECGYIPALTLGVLYQHMVQHHPEVSERPRTCDMCGINVSPNEVEKHFQKHDNILAKKVSKSIYPQTWVRKAGRWVPKQYKKSLYPKQPGSQGPP